MLYIFKSYAKTKKMLYKQAFCVYNGVNLVKRLGKGRGQEVLKLDGPRDTTRRNDFAATAEMGYLSR